MPVRRKESKKKRKGLFGREGGGKGKRGKRTISEGGLLVGRGTTLGEKYKV